MKTFIIWAIPHGKTDRLDERPLTSFPLTGAQADKVQEFAKRDGWHSFRRAVETNEIPDFAKAVLTK